MDEDIWRQSADAWLQTGSEESPEKPRRAISVLRAAEQFVLCNMRLWWNSEGHHGACARALVRNGFVAANLPQTAHESFEQFMTVLATAGQPRPMIHATTYADVSDDEVRLLNVVALCQDGHNGHAIMVLKRWLPPTAYRVSLKNVVSFAGLAATQGLALPMRLEVSPGARSEAGRGPRYLLH